MSSYAPMTCCRLLLAATLMLLPALAGHAQSRSASTQFDNTTINDQVNLQVLGSVVREMNNSFNRSCTDPIDGSKHAHGTSWANTTCPVPLGNGKVTYVCISGYNSVLASTCH